MSREPWNLIEMLIAALCYKDAGRRWCWQGGLTLERMLLYQSQAASFCVREGRWMTLETVVQKSRTETEVHTSRAFRLGRMQVEKKATTRTGEDHDLRSLGSYGSLSPFPGDLVVV